MAARRSPVALDRDAVAALAAALAALDVDVHAESDGGGLEVRVDDRALRADVHAVSYCTGQRARELVRRRRATKAGPLRVVVADRITADARDVLTAAGWSWFDRRGRVRLRGPGILVDADVPRVDAPRSPADGASAIAGRGGLAVAYWICEHPGEALSPRRDAPSLGLAPSTVSTAVRRLAEAGLVDDRGAGVFPELFWELAAAWQVAWTWLVRAPVPADGRAGRWSRTGTAAAIAYGAPIAAAGDGPVQLYLPDAASTSVAVRRYGVGPAGAGASMVAVAPVPAVVEPREGVPSVGRWPAAPLLAVALDLSRDRGRGREVLDDWVVDGAVWR
jgi:DNA-binding transcriptional ArsR family regulator